MDMGRFNRRKPTPSSSHAAKSNEEAAKGLGKRYRKSKSISSAELGNSENIEAMDGSGSRNKII